MNSSAIAQMQKFLAEDIASGDITSALLGTKKIKAKIITRDDAVISGAKYAAKIFTLKNSRARALVGEGQNVKSGTKLVSISGQARHILECERVALNLLSRMSGIATMTKKMISAMPARSPEIYATRKTAPGLRLFDKEAVVAGGGHKHRMALDSAIMIKDNHLASGFSIIELINRAKKKNYKNIQVEVEDATSAIIAAKCGATSVLLDNFTPRKASNAISAMRSAGVRNKVHVEISGGITLRNIASYAKVKADAISSGQITSSAPSVNLSLEIES